MSAKNFIDIGQLLQLLLWFLGVAQMDSEFVSKICIFSHDVYDISIHLDNTSLLIAGDVFHYCKVFKILALCYVCVHVQYI
jgi:hypothetical protein